jgi:hypothetical protein
MVQIVAANQKIGHKDFLNMLEKLSRVCSVKQL